MDSEHLTNCMIFYSLQGLLLFGVWITFKLWIVLNVRFCSRRYQWRSAFFSLLKVIEFDDGSGSVLRIQPLRVHRDEAIYECTATNSVGEINTSAKLTVLEGKWEAFPYLRWQKTRLWLWYLHVGVVALNETAIFWLGLVKLCSSWIFCCNSLLVIKANVFQQSR